MNEVTTINHSNDDRQQRAKYNQTDGSIQKEPGTQKAITTINNTISM
jgi:hypothetical protein